nr:glutaredoxin family protein [Deinobacterium chartae]
MYSRPGCHLCEQAEALLRDLGLEFTVVDISNDADLEAAFGWDIPVLTHGNQVLLKGIFNRVRLERAGLTFSSVRR